MVMVLAPDKRALQSQAARGARDAAENHDTEMGANRVGEHNGTHPASSNGTAEQQN
jgi:hypothetical protein